MKQVTLLFLITDLEVLLAMKKRGFGVGKWNGVGGKVEVGETIEQALIRECQEEIGVTPKTFTKAAEIIFHEYYKDSPVDLHVHAYICTSWTGEPVETDEMKPQWFPQDQLPLTSMWADDEYWLPRVLAGEKLSCEFTLDANNQVINHTIGALHE